MQGADRFDETCEIFWMRVQAARDIQNKRLGRTENKRHRLEHRWAPGALLRFCILDDPSQFLMRSGLSCCATQLNFSARRAARAQVGPHEHGPGGERREPMHEFGEGSGGRARFMRTQMR
jgi:hypothetical protein